jgi:hypothetical protein
VAPAVVQLKVDQERWLKVRKPENSRSFEHFLKVAALASSRR